MKTYFAGNIDEAFRRRFNKLIYVPLPGLIDRAKIFKSFLKRHDNYLTVDDYYFLALITKYYSPNDIENICCQVLQERMKRAKMADFFKICPINTGTAWPCLSTDCGNPKPAKSYNVKDIIALPPINMKDVERAMMVVKKTVDKTELSKLSAFAKEYGMAENTVLD
jgi:vacuolar protein-sorting-associated protein 4